MELNLKSRRDLQISRVSPFLGKVWSRSFTGQSPKDATISTQVDPPHGSRGASTNDSHKVHEECGETE